MKLFAARHTTRAVGFRLTLGFGVALGFTCGGCVPDRTAQSQAVAATPTPRPSPRPTATPKPRVAPQTPLARWARGKTVKQVALAPGERAIALTFDDGPWPHSTLRILKILRKEKVPATFYMLGSCVQNYPKLARAVHDGGHAIGNHSWSHPVRTRHAKMEIDRTDAIIKRTVGITPTTFRPPYGIVSNGMADVAKRGGKAVVLWSADSMDWRHATVSSILSRLERQCGRGGIALMHDGGGNRRATADALPTLIYSLRARGFRFVTVPQLLAMRAAPKRAPNPKLARFQFGPFPQKTSKLPRDLPKPRERARPASR